MTNQTFKRGLIVQGIFYALVFVPYYVGKIIAILKISEVYDDSIPTWAIGVIGTIILGIGLICVGMLIYNIVRWILGIKSDDVGW